MGEQKLNIVSHLSRVTVLRSDRIKIYIQASWTWAPVFFPLRGPRPLENVEIEIAAGVQDSGNISCFLLIKKQGGEGREESTTEL